MGIQNEMNLENDFGFLIHTFTLKICLSPICLYREAIRLQCFTPTRYVKDGNTGHEHAYYVDDLYPICSKQHYMVYACILWPYYACSYT